MLQPENLKQHDDHCPPIQSYWYGSLNDNLVLLDMKQLGIQAMQLKDKWRVLYTHKFKANWEKGFSLMKELDEFILAWQQTL